MDSNETTMSYLNVFVFIDYEKYSDKIFLIASSKDFRSVISNCYINRSAVGDVLEVHCKVEDIYKAIEQINRFMPYVDPEQVNEFHGIKSIEDGKECVWLYTGKDLIKDPQPFYEEI